ncbi:unnamed protein product [Fraxinus pennsylvanica]|uniref:UDP-glycosyltransferase n=1 Tax=Fraxinus pennsylvanica TaxID=56036 RepID=A0AAD1ZZM7_9LAMI|nr:unnamed protein product [Fraxinus pennsylvanica]
MIIALSKSYGLLVNSFYELEPLYAEYWNRESTPKAFCVGPLCIARQQKMGPVLHQECRWIKWLDQKLAQKKPVLYIAFGSQAEISSTQLREIAHGLEESKGFLSHCGWNLLLESISAEVPILTWPIMVKQPLNTKMAVEEIKIGLRVETVNGTSNKFVPAESLKNKVKELLEGKETR